MEAFSGILSLAIAIFECKRRNWTTWKNKTDETAGMETILSKKSKRNIHIGIIEASPATSIEQDEQYLLLFWGASLYDGV